MHSTALKQAVLLGLGLLVTAFFAFTPLSAQRVHAQNASVCPPGFQPGGNLVVNGDFSIGAGPGPGIDPAAGFTSGIPNNGDGTYPPDTSFAIQAGTVDFTVPPISQPVFSLPFPGDPEFGIPAANNLLYSNGNDVGSPGPIVPYTIWEQTVTGLQPNTVYAFFAYVNNLITPNLNVDDPIIQFFIDGVPQGGGFPVPELPDQWVRVGLPYTTGPAQTSATLRLQDSQTSVNGDDFGLTVITFAQCQPIPQPPGPAPQNALISKTASTQLASAGDTVVWTITVTNPFDQQMINVQVDDRLPDQVEIVSTSATSGSITVNGQVFQLIAGIIPPRSSMSITITTRVRPGVPAGTPITNQACLMGDPNRCASATVNSIGGIIENARVQTLPATGQSPLSPLRPLVFGGVAAIAGVWLWRRLRRPARQER